MNEPKIEWGRAELNGLLERWPKGEDGRPVQPVLLCRESCVDMSDRLRVNMLEAYGIPCLRRFPENGSFGRVVLGMSGNGADLYVPETMLEDAQNLISEDGEYDDDEQ